MKKFEAIFSDREKLGKLTAKLLSKPLLRRDWSKSLKDFLETRLF